MFLGQYWMCARVRWGMGGVSAYVGCSWGVGGLGVHTWRAPFPMWWAGMGQAGGVRAAAGSSTHLVQLCQAGIWDGSSSGRSQCRLSCSTCTGDFLAAHWQQMLSHLYFYEPIFLWYLK